MNFHPVSMGLFYFIMGVIFTYLAIHHAENGMWTATNMILMILATFDFAVSIRMFTFSYKIRKAKNNR
ncbi:DUF4305 domain-containing protein [Aeribacillus pallidus]|uniref:YdiK family protein n=1 Tax=Aeribacillus pallidus TaxID=33936 RepID=UPI001022EE64|nr:YdiK family protein [Aeribacillus pallidus]RZI50655.1 DUF4305 domain-containing protein [Aeribacillus pallidus]